VSFLTTSEEWRWLGGALVWVGALRGDVPARLKGGPGSPIASLRRQRVPVLTTPSLQTVKSLKEKKKDKEKKLTFCTTCKFSGEERNCPFCK